MKPEPNLTPEKHINQHHCQPIRIAALGKLLSASALVFTLIPVVEDEKDPGMVGVVAQEAFVHAETLEEVFSENWMLKFSHGTIASTRAKVSLSSSRKK